MPSGRRPGGLAAALEEERLELASELRNSSGARNSTTNSSYAPPRRSILDTATGPSPGYVAPRHGSIAGIGVGVTPPAGRDYQDSQSPQPSPPAMDGTTDTPSSSPSPTQAPADSPSPVTTPKPAYTSLKTAPPPLKRPDPPASKDKKKNGDKKSSSPEARRPSIRWDSGVDMPPSANGSRRFGFGPPQEKAPRALPGQKAMAAVMSGFGGLPSFSRGRDSSRGASKRGTSLDSHLPSQARRAQSGSPARRLPRSNLRSSVSEASKTAPEKKPEAADEKLLQPSSANRGSEADTKGSTSGDERLYDSDNNASDSSDEEEEESSSDEGASSENNGDDMERGRKKVSDRDTSNESDTLDGTKPALDEVAAEKETKNKGPELIHSSKTGPVPKTTEISEVQPPTNFDAVPSVLNTPFGSDDEAELSDIKRAQKLSIQMSSVDNSIRNRSIRTIIRGDYTNMQVDAEGGKRRQRKYLVTTDLSEESVYALEWTIGTILRDGDTLFAVFAMHEETGTQVGDGAKATQDVAAVVGSQTAETVQKTQNDGSNTNNLSRAIFNRLGTGTDSRPGSVDSRAMSKAEAERSHAVQIISQTCVRLLRKTLLQVRIAVEVIHCKSPKNMITEAIDGLEPTLVIVGARGRSALKGVLLGSFSNFLVTNSSVPVMVARKKLKKKAKNKTQVRLSNNLTAPKKLASARVD
ncbi:universal stress protein family domain protein [Aspergillus stella-maris]|uniref:universal stress protein family domain protein n=1 Tax=Aspergillus stella-maris TaxID=1810926 RepID=UPI003CCDE61F